MHHCLLNQHIFSLTSLTGKLDRTQRAVLGWICNAVTYSKSLMQQAKACRAQRAESWHQILGCANEDIKAWIIRRHIPKEH